MAARCGLGLFGKLWPWPTLLDANLALAKAGTRFWTILSQLAPQLGPRGHPEGMHVHTFGRGLEGIRIPSGHVD